MGKKIIFFILIVIIVIGIYGLPKIVETTENFPYIKLHWEKTEKQDHPISPVSISGPKIKEIKIESLQARQQIYAPEDSAYVDFYIKNTRDIPYNITVDWLFNNTRYHGWSNISTEVYNETDEDNYYWSSYVIPSNLKGDWQVHLVVSYLLNNMTFSSDKTTIFEVV